MEFFIRKGSSEPILKMRLIDDAKNDKSSFNDRLENADIRLSMYHYETMEPHLLNEVCNITTRTKKYDQTTDEYYIVYKFNSNQTSIIGKYEGVITIYFNDIESNKLILPIKEKLFINII
jgi:hypothetical protein